MEKRIEYPCVGLTYNYDKYGVYEYDEHPESSVLAGQVRRVFLDSFDTEDEAAIAYPDAERGCQPGFDMVAAIYDMKAYENEYDDWEYDRDDY